MTTKIAFNQIEGMAVSVKDYGAVMDGVTDDSTAIQAAFDYAKEKDATVVFPNGPVLIGTTININSPGGGAA